MLWDTTRGRAMVTFEMRMPVLAVSWSPDGGRLAAQLENGDVILLDGRGSD